MLGLDLMGTLLLLLVVVLGAAVGVLVVMLKLRSINKAELKIETQIIAERVRAVGKLVGLEVSAKEIATTKSGLGWLPPLLLSQARLAMIFHFQKQYYVDLRKLGPTDVTEPNPGRFVVTLPPLDGYLTLTAVTPYDIQQGRMLGLFDVIPMNAERQAELMNKAQQQAAELFETNDAGYLAEARASIERHLRSLLELFDIDVEIAWRTESAGTATLNTLDLRTSRAAVEKASPRPV